MVTDLRKDSSRKTTLAFLIGSSTLILCIVVAILLLVDRIVNNRYSDRIVIQTIEIPGGHLEWYTYSEIGSYGPDYITINKRKKRKRVLKSSNVTDISFIEPDTIIIQLYKNYHHFEINTDMGYFLKIDTTGNSMDLAQSRGRKKDK